jgi:PPM family protein phosphatase
MDYDAWVKHCPKCGATGTDEDLFCEDDGLRLVGDAGEQAAPAKKRASRACSACGLEDADSGDGYCSSCGHRLGPMSTTPPVPLGATVFGHEIVSPRGADDFLVRSADGQTMALALGDAADLAIEADALAKVKAKAWLPPAAQQGEDLERGAVLVLTATPAARRLVECATALPVAEMIALMDGVLEVAAAASAAGFSWRPGLQDLNVADDGSLVLSRLRCSRGPTADVRELLERIGTLLLPMPGALAPPRLVRLLLPRSPPQSSLPLSPEDARQELALAARELVAPADVAPGLAELCDPGLRRDHNEDATAVAAGEIAGERWAVLVVCDGVSSSDNADQASTIAARTARDALAHFLRSGDIAFEGAPSAMSAALRAAHVAVCATPIEHTRPGDPKGKAAPPGTTIVAALVHRRRIVVGWVGDSRAYWIAPSGAELLTRDHSWVNETVAKGEMTEAEAMVAPLAHALTRCLGPLEVGEEKIEEVDPEVRVRDLPGAGDIVLCTDGLWNYYPRAPEVAAVVRSAGPGASASLVARCLVNHALSQGGGDNVSVAVYKHK